MIKDKIEDDIKRAMKENYPTVRDALRFLKSKIQQYEIDSRKVITDEYCIQIIKTIIKQNEETLSYSPKNAQKLKIEQDIWNHYVPKQLSEVETKLAIELIIKAHNIEGIKQIGKVMGEIRKQLGGTIDMAIASKITKKILIGV